MACGAATNTLKTRGGAAPPIPSTASSIASSRAAPMATIARSERLTLRSIRVRAALLTSVLIAVALIAVIAFTFWATRQSLARTGEARAAGVAGQLAGLLGPPIPLRVADLSRLADDDRVRRALRSEERRVGKECSA